MTTRVTYDFLDFIGDIGGVLEFILFSFQIVAKLFSSLRFKSLITNRLSQISYTSRRAILSKKEVDRTDDGFITENRLVRSTNGNITVDVPYWLDCEQLRVYLCRCFCRSKSESFDRY